MKRGKQAEEVKSMEVDTVMAEGGEKAKNLLHLFIATKLDDHIPRASVGAVPSPVIQNGLRIEFTF